MKKNRIQKCIFVFIFLFFLSGFEFTQKEDNYYLEKINEIKKTTKITFLSPYPKVFQAVVNVFRDLNINIVKKDYAGKFIYGIYTTDYFSRACYGIYAISFNEQTDNITEIIVKVDDRAWFGPEFFCNKIKEEIKLEKEFELQQRQEQQRQEEGGGGAK